MKKSTSSNEVVFVNDLKTLATYAPFDRIFLLQVLEHLYNPKETLGFLSTLLSPEGKMLLETPVREGWDSSIRPLEYWGGWHAPRHFHIWSQKSLDKLFKITGFNVEEYRYIPSPYQWSQLLRLKAPKFLRSIISSDNVLFVIPIFLIDLFQIKFWKKSSNLRIIISGLK